MRQYRKACCERCTFYQPLIHSYGHTCGQGVSIQTVKPIGNDIDPPVCVDRFHPPANFCCNLYKRRPHDRQLPNI